MSHAPSSPTFSGPAPKRVQLMLTCLADAIYGDIGRATVEILEHLGVEVEFPEGQTCCGQPAFNAGDWPRARQVVRHTVETFRGDLPVIVPSGSCAAMCKHGADLAFEKEDDRADVKALGERSWEVLDFIVNRLGVRRWPGKMKGRYALHRSCHLRGSRSAAAAELLLGSMEGVEVVPFGEVEQCCGFGGTFSVGFPHISAAMGRLKLDHLREANVDGILSLDMSCLMHMTGLEEKAGRSLNGRHVVQVLRDSLRAAGQGGKS